MSEWAYKWISFDMSREGLIYLESLLDSQRQKAMLTDELQNFHNEIQNMLERQGFLAARQESSWLDA